MRGHGRGWYRLWFAPTAGVAAMTTELALDDNTRGALVGAGVIAVIVICILIAIFWPDR